MSTSSSDSATALTHLAHNSQPIDKLPDEILEQIFLISNKPRTSGIPSHESLKASLRISWVCSRWRAVALSSREFWARCVSLESTSRKVRGVQLGHNIMQDEFIRRSDPWPLDLCGATILAERLPMFTDPCVARRTRSLRIHFQKAHLEYIFAFFNQSLPRLETICLTTEGQVQTNFAISKGSLAGADNVKEIRCIYGVNFDLKSFLDEPTLIHRLTILELNYIPTMIYCNYFLQFLAKARNLESLFLRTKIIFEPLSLEWQRGGIKLPNLKKVSVELSSPVAVAILQSVSFPSSLSTFVLKVSLQDIRHYPTILSGLEDLLRHWDRQWNHSVGIILDTDAVFFIEAIDSPMIIDDIDIIGWPTHVSKFSFRVQDSKLADGNEPALTIRRATTHLAYTAIQAFESMILSAADRVSIQKYYGIPVTLDAVSSESSTINLAMNGSWNLLDGLLNNETLSNITELSLFQDSHPFIQHVHERVVDSMQEAARRGVSEYSFLPKLRVITFRLLSHGDHLPLCRNLVEAGFLIERTVTLDLKVTLPGRYEGECPVQEAIEELLTVS